jgi:hypothetical protein
MAHFIQFHQRDGKQVWINLEIVWTVKPEDGGSRLYSAYGESEFVNEPPAEVLGLPEGTK